MNQQDKQDIDLKQFFNNMPNKIRVRGFEVAKGYEDQEINLPRRQTNQSAGYDFESAESVTIPTLWGRIIPLIKVWINGDTINEDSNRFKSMFEPHIVHTGIKAYMRNEEALFMYNRSGNPVKLQLLLTNGVGVVDSDYYSNKKNDGEIMFQFINFGLRDRHIKKGDRIGQGVFQSFLKTDDDFPVGQERQGGTGHTGV